AASGRAGLRLHLNVQHARSAGTLQHDSDRAKLNLALLDRLGGGEVRQPSPHQVAASDRNTVQRVQAEPNRVKVRRAVRGADDRGRAARLLPQVDERDTPVRLNLTAKFVPLT